MKSFSIIIPTYNEKKNIRVLVNKISKFLNKQNHEIIVVDDNSLDGSLNEFYNIKKVNKKFSFYIRKEKEKDLFKSILY